jgi:hypothetical protein
MDNNVIKNSRIECKKDVCICVRDMTQASVALKSAQCFSVGQIMNFSIDPE